MECDKRALVVLERRIRVPLVHDALVGELLVVIADLYCEDAGILNSIIGYHELAIVIYLRRKLVRSQPHF